MMAVNNNLFLEIRVLCGEPLRVSGTRTEIVMVPFTGSVSGDLFTGETLGTGVDTQKIGKDGTFLLSARYMLEGTDAAGNACRIYIENQGNEDTGFIPRIVTDSPLLQAWETEDLYSMLEGTPDGVIVRIFRR